MKSIVYTRTGSPDVLELVDREPIDPQPGEVRVRMAVSGVNPTDWKARQGSGDGAALPAPQVPNQDGAGVIESVALDVGDFAAGDRVWIWDAAFQRTEGTAQELVTVPASQVVKLPDDASFDVGASVGIPALTAHRALTAHEGSPAELTPRSLHGTTVLVSGGAGAVGHAAIQLAAWAGATVITTVSSAAKAQLARDAGAHYVINYKTEDAAARVAEAGHPAIIVEVNAGANIGLDLDVIAQGGTIAIYAGGDEDQLSFPQRAIMGKNVRIQGILTYTTSPEQKRAAVRAVSAAIADGALAVGEPAGLPITRYPLERTADAHRAVEEGAVGKVLIDVADLG